MLRIIPAYWVALVIIGLIAEDAVLFNQPVDYLYYFGFVWIYSPEHLLAPITQAWTVASEVVWYLILPILGLAVCRVPGSRSRKLKVQLVPIALFAVASFVFVVLTRDAGSNRLMYSQWLLTYMDCVAIGMLFAVVIAWQRLPGGPRLRLLDDRRIPAACWIVAFGGYGAMVAFTGLPVDRFQYTPTQYVWQHGCTVIFASLLLFPLVFGPLREGRLRRFLASRPMAWLGLISYGIYLWHIYWIGQYVDWFDIAPGQMSMPPAIGFVFVTTVITAAASYYLLERPVQRWGNRHR
jgi:peptidoglycan/LPS O-acetylase OafA/YrhL